MVTRILVLVSTMAAAGCVAAESHAPVDDQVVLEGPLVEADVVGRWVARNAPNVGEVLDLRANGVFQHTPAPVLRAVTPPPGTWHLTDFAGTQYLVTVVGGTSAQKTGTRGATTLELTPGGTYDLTVAP